MALTPESQEEGPRGLIPPSPQDSISTSRPVRKFAHRSLPARRDVSRFPTGEEHPAPALVTSGAAPRLGSLVVPATGSVRTQQAAVSLYSAPLRRRDAAPPAPLPRPRSHLGPTDNSYRRPPPETVVAPTEAAPDPVCSSALRPGRRRNYADEATEDPAEAAALRHLWARSLERREGLRRRDRLRDAGTIQARAREARHQRVTEAAAKADAKGRRVKRRTSRDSLHRLQQWLSLCLLAVRATHWDARLRGHRDHRRREDDLRRHRTTLATALRPLIRRWRLHRLTGHLRAVQAGTYVAKDHACALLVAALRNARRHRFHALVARGAALRRRSAVVLQRAVRSYLRRRRSQDCDLLIGWAGVRDRLRSELPAVLRRRLVTAQRAVGPTVAPDDIVDTLRGEYRRLLEDTHARLTAAVAATTLSARRATRTPLLSAGVGRAMMAQDAAAATGRRPGGHRGPKAGACIVLDDTEIELLPDADPRAAPFASLRLSLRRPDPAPAADALEALFVRALGQRVLAMGGSGASPASPLDRIPDAPLPARSSPSSLAPRTRFRWTLTRSEMADLLLRTYLADDPLASPSH